MYTGYQTIYGDTYDINCIMSDPDFSKDFAVNEYLLITNKDDGTTKEMRFDGAAFVPLRLPPARVIKAKNSLQRCALDLLNNPLISTVAILGPAGSGKTYEAMRMALYHIKEKGTQSKVFGVRNPKGQGTAVGYLPGTLEDKTDAFFLPLAQQLDGGEFELERLKQMGTLEASIPYYLKGLSFNDTIVVADEAEDFSKEEIVLIGTRIGQGSRLFMVGDYKQSVADRSESNPLVLMCKQLRGNPLFGCIFLDEDVRSETSKMFAALFGG